MSLLTPTTDPDADAASGMKSLIRVELRRAAENLGAITALLWRNDAPDPQGVFDEFATNAGKVIDVIDAYVDFITALATANGETIGDYIASANYDPTPLVFTVNMDGTVTVT